MYKSLYIFYSMTFNNENCDSILWEELDKKEEFDELRCSWASLEAQMVKNLHVVQETWV